jgi:hypothetical protein
MTDIAIKHVNQKVVRENEIVRQADKRECKFREREVELFVAVVERVPQ